ncbi:xanthine dehydrogenase accessory factor [Octadecabacter temperatus]|uniref:Putative xanthine dehydrogenase subunit A n=1 Tax=Octadecabacter temperatus TaxID=1458307 RepID=A0A0K0Y4S0_9RHOB|nr:XdhC family protein [Octadecabacter temperatus]AKS45832.1 putative xanthine dehydrogenase subunit A [Octadecabacter temperatus]SIO01544.1 xanthine dehydrogenase accessory factor [Octadecabacter temperatus]
MNDLGGLPKLALDWHLSGQGAVLATVVETWGSAPRPAGSQLAIRADGHMEGSVSGGCVEGAVIVEAMDALNDGKQRLLDFGVSDDEAFAVGLACGGRIRVLVEPVGGALPVDVLTKLVATREASESIAYVADLHGEARSLVGCGSYPDRFRLDRSGVEEDGQTFVAVHNPPLRMIIVGGVHIAQHLAPMARACGYDVTLVDPRTSFASPARFPDVTIIEEWPDAALEQLGLDARTAVVTLTHDPKLDDPAIMTALRSDVFYLGCLGSTRTHAKRVTRLNDAGFSDELERINAPVGLDIGGRSVAEIAVSIIAQVTQALRQG